MVGVLELLSAADTMARFSGVNLGLEYGRVGTRKENSQDLHRLIEEVPAEF
jgi:hypothetical protein